MSIAYDPNGNIDSLRRRGYERTSGFGASGQMDQLTYTYSTAGGAPLNRLEREQVGLNNTNVYATDLDNQTNTVNYEYDRNGSVVHDKSEQTFYRWNTRGKLVLSH